MGDAVKMPKFAVRTLAAAVTAAAIAGGGATAAQADYQTSGTVSGKTFLQQVGGVYNYYKITVGGRTFCIGSSQNSANDPNDASRFTKVYSGPASNRISIGAQGVNNGDRARVQVNTDSKPTGCGNLNIGYLAFINE